MRRMIDRALFVADEQAYQKAKIVGSSISDSSTYVRVLKFGARLVGGVGSRRPTVRADEQCDIPA
jgi:hypothetical protein